MSAFGAAKSAFGAAQSGHWRATLIATDVVLGPCIFCGDQISEKDFDPVAQRANASAADVEVTRRLGPMQRSSRRSTMVRRSCSGIART